MEELMKEDAVQSPAPETKKKWRPHLPKSKKGKRWLKILIAVLVVAAIVAGCVSSLQKNVNSTLAGTYLVATATRQDLTVSVSGTATLEPADSYNVTTLISGEILNSPFEVGDLVDKDALLYEMDSSDAQDSMDRAQISVQQAQMSYQQAQEALHPTAPLSGIIGEVYVHNGQSVTAGTQIAKVVASTELTMDFLFVFAEPSDFYVGQPATIFIDGFDGTQMGTVTYISSSSTITANGKQAVSVRVRLNNPGAVSDSFTATAVIGNYTSYGDTPVAMPASSVVCASASGTINDLNKLAGATVSKGETLCTVESDAIRNQIESARLNLESAQLSAGTASDSVEDYNITAPIAGTVVASKAAQNAAASTTEALFSISASQEMQMSGLLNEYDATLVTVGMPAQVTTDATGEAVMDAVVTVVSPTAADASGDFTVTVKLTNPDPALRVGMTGKMRIILAQAEDCFYVPTDSIGVDGDGNSYISVYDEASGQTQNIGVTTGVANDYYTQVTGEGLTADLQVCAMPQF